MCGIVAKKWYKYKRIYDTMDFIIEYETTDCLKYGHRPGV